MKKEAKPSHVEDTFKTKSQSHEKSAKALRLQCGRICFVVISVIVYLLSKADRKTWSFNHSKHMRYSLKPQKRDQTEEEEAARHVFFLHVGKTGGTTVSNVLRLYALKHNLTYPVLSEFDWWSDHYLDYVINQPEMGGRKGKFDMFFEQMLFNHEAVTQMAYSDVTYITMLRHPMAQLRSLFDFLKLGERFGIDGSTTCFEKNNSTTTDCTSDQVEIFLHDPAKWDKHESGKNYNFSITNCYQLRSFTDCDSKQVRTSFEQVLARIERQFDVIMLQEYFDESIVLLRRALNFSPLDVVYVTTRKRYYPNKHQKVRTETLQRHRKWNPLDYALYDHVLTRFRQRLQDKSIQNEVKEFRKLNRVVQKKCNDMFKLLRRYKRGDVSTTDVVGHLETVIVKAGKQQVLARDCVILALNPIAFYAQKQLTHPSKN